MDRAFLEKTERFDVIQKGIIAGNFTNRDEVLKSEEVVAFEEEVRKGSVEVITIDDVKEDYNDKYWLGKDINNFKQELEAKITKGEEDSISHEEMEQVQKGIADINKLERKAMAVPNGDSHLYAEIFVLPNESKEE